MKNIKKWEWWFIKYSLIKTLFTLSFLLPSLAFAYPKGKYCGGYLGLAIKPKVQTTSNSFSEKYPGLLQRVREKDNFIKTLQAEFDMMKSHLSFENLVFENERIFEEFQNALAELRLLVKENEKFETMIDSAIEHAKLNREKFEQYKNAVLAQRKTSLDGRTLIERNLGIMTGEIGEIEFAVQVGEFVEKGKTFVNSNNEKLGEVDIVHKLIDGRTAWCEVKNFSRMLTMDDGRMKSLVEQLKKIKGFRDQENSIIEVQVYIRGGMTKEVKKTIEEMGVYVH